MMELSSLCSSHEGSSGSRATKGRGMLLLRFVQRGVTGLPGRRCYDTCDQLQIITTFCNGNRSIDGDAFQGLLIASLDTWRRIFTSRVLRRNAAMSEFCEFALFSHSFLFFPFLSFPRLFRLLFLFFERENSYFRPHRRGKNLIAFTRWAVARYLLGHTLIINHRVITEHRELQ